MTFPFRSMINTAEATIVKFYKIQYNKRKYGDSHNRQVDSNQVDDAMENLSKQPLHLLSFNYCILLVDRPKFCSRSSNQQHNTPQSRITQLLAGEREVERPLSISGRGAEFSRKR